MPVDSSLEKTADRPARAVASSGVVPLLVVGGLLAAVVAAALLAAAGEPIGPGVVNAYGPTVIRVAAEIGCALTVGALLFAAFLAPPQQSGTMAVAGYAGLRMASWAAILWFVSAVVSVPFAAATAIGKPVTDVLDTRTLVELTKQLPEAKAWLFTAAVISRATRCRCTWWRRRCGSAAWSRCSHTAAGPGSTSRSRSPGSPRSPSVAG